MRNYLNLNYECYPFPSGTSPKNREEIADIISSYLSARVNITLFYKSERFSSLDIL
ncbi:hypothetical protein AHMF7616_02555 [Adhaeribacter pallidiroseus]|uniref:Uncharacterized protein n=1 Tax=Adhaeribacter pallidiroseus TaxID=2072847 RepID=A0A369QL46_9BACT|nr:hypothetical protein AHMF7616_02555 [Adhaeribacter pallidiroseus]